MLGMLSGLIGGAKSYIIMAVLGAVVIGAAYFYFNYTQNKIAELNKTIATQELSIQIQHATIEKLNFHIKLSNEARYELDREYAKIEQDVGKLAKLFSDHDFGNLALKKSGLIENLVNKGTKKIFTHFEEISNPERF